MSPALAMLRRLRNRDTLRPPDRYAVRDEEIHQEAEDTINMPLHADAGGNSSYSPWSYTDLTTISQELPRTSRIGQSWVTTFEKHSAGFPVDVGDDVRDILCYQ